MKKLILIIAVVALMVNSSKGQDNQLDLRKKFMFGIKAGANLSNVYDTKSENFHTDPKFGFAGGAFFSIPIGRYFGLQPEVLFSQKGFRSTSTVLGRSYSLTRTTNFIDVPLLFQLKPSDFFTVVVGPQFSYLLNQKDVFGNSTTSIEQETAFENNDVRKNTFCLTGGIDFNIRHFNKKQQSDYPKELYYSWIDQF